MTLFTTLLTPTDDPLEEDLPSFKLLKLQLFSCSSFFLLRINLLCYLLPFLVVALVVCHHKKQKKDYTNRNTYPCFHESRKRFTFGANPHHLRRGSLFEVRRILKRAMCSIRVIFQPLTCINNFITY